VIVVRDLYEVVRLGFYDYTAFEEGKLRFVPFFLSNSLLNAELRNFDGFPFFAHFVELLTSLSKARIN
jgi:hypothetical protein